MTDVDRLVVWLREAMDAAGRDAEAVQSDPRLSPQDPVEFILAGQDITTPATEGAERHLRRQSPAAVLRRIAADRKLLEDCENVIGGWHYAETKELAETTIRNLAEGWGWTEETP